VPSKEYPVCNHSRYSIYTQNAFEVDLSTASEITCAMQDEIEDLNDTEEAQHGRTSSIPPKSTLANLPGSLFAVLCHHHDHCCGQAGHSSGLFIQNVGMADFPGSVA